jgi:hypothetical protein
LGHLQQLDQDLEASAPLLEQGQVQLLLIGQEKMDIV